MNANAAARTHLLRKYNVPGPRYTSYPTVPYWETTPTEAEWIAALGRSLEGSKGAAVYVHVPFCRSLCTYCGCNVRITRNRAIAQPYLETVLAEWKLYLDKLGVQRIPLSEIHLGGGTPTFLTPEEIRFLVEGLLAHADVTPDAEYSIEADPRVTDAGQLKVLGELGFRRLSLGIQDFDPRVQDIVNRVQSEEEVRVLTEQARELGFTSINYDLIYGLPLQTMNSVEQTLAAVGRLRPDRIAFYGYAHVPWIKPSQRRFTEDDLPQGDAKRALYERGRQILEDAGYREIGMDHFALETDSLWQAAGQGTLHRNFMGYTSSLVSPLFGLGVSAIGDAWSAFAQNEKIIEPYRERIEKGELPLLRGHVLDGEDLELRQHILNLMTRFHTHWDAPEQMPAYLQALPERLHELSADQLIRIGTGCTGTDLEVTDLGRAFIRNICMAFDARLARKAPDTKLFSQTV